jgi:transposase
MRFYQPHTRYCCGVDLHARSMYVCVVDREDDSVRLHRKLRCDGEAFLRVLTPYRSDVTVAVESTFNWYWLADLCRDHDIEFALGHALYMKAIHGAKTKNDRIDSKKIALLTKAGLLPMGYVYPRERRSLRDLLRRRLRFVRQRAELLGHLHHVNAQLNLPELGRTARFKTKRSSIPPRFSDKHARASVEADLSLIGYLDQVISSLERHILEHARDCRSAQLRVLQSVPGIGDITALTIILEIDDVERFATRQQFASYSRLVKCPQLSDGKRCGTGGHKIGNPYLKWAFSEAAVHGAQYSEVIASYLRRRERKHGKGKAKSLLAHKLGRVVYHMLKNGTVFDEERFLAA